ncbi:elongin-A-like [Mixophyes fleayi]|uniref:elongin-A-like n=1 Tax=Mixophyes fleayi TaxID=3061075 RepID=UPI003F4DC362
MDTQLKVQRVQQLKERLGHTQDPRKISKALKSLQELDISLDILVETGVGKTVNSFRKHAEVGDIAKSIVLQWKQLVPEVKESDQKPKSKHEQKHVLEDKLLSKERDWRSKKICESQIDVNKRKESIKTEEPNIYEKKHLPKEKMPEKNMQSKEHKLDKSHSNSHSKREKSKMVEPQEKLEKHSQSSSTRKKNKSSTKDECKPSEHISHNKKDGARQGSVKESVDKKTESILSNDEFEAPTMSFESYLSYDQVSVKRKRKPNSLNEPPKKIQVCKQYSSVELSKSVNQNNTENKKEELQDRVAEVKKSCLEDLLNVPLPKILLDYSLLPSPPHYSECKGNVPEPLPEMSSESSGFTGRRLNSKMLVYSGSKTTYLPKMLTLYEQCIRILQNNIDSIQEVGGVPFEILQPVLERCTPEQLNRIEECNPAFIEDSGHLWNKHCNRDFKGHRLLQYESWREMYLRLFSEREEKLRMITQNISSAHSGKPKGRQVKLAYIHGAAKPPRNIRRKQEIHGTAGPIAQPHPIDKYKLQKLESKGTTVSNQNQSAPVTTSVPVSNSQFGSQNQDPKKTVKKIAPMMAKSMRAFKNRVGPR